ncbi:PEP-CTERM sorting domain-containing protein [Duganella sp. FT134W]|uniref:PEP-CTERM sorting domain-containing protein n=1 Tax=Duganella margarita TaxID=2692170 RepID=A0A7X4KH44_9BURK|nr:FxDxF family PEP-CTERM protein [Duganella margarita]MYM74166.1 PEP-CTERM sorting domain-containing protein [Duganella margarita]
MKIKSFIAAAALVVAAIPSFATTITLTQSPTNSANYTGGFNISHTAAFTDTYTFLPVLPSSSVTASLISIGLASQNINFTNVTLNGRKLDLVNGFVDTAVTSDEWKLFGPLTLIVSGTSGTNASYAGTINVTAVPEPETFAMLGAGLALVGFAARRRKAANQA